jgi:uncharacterized protein (TIGR02680 family)
MATTFQTDRQAVRDRLAPTTIPIPRWTLNRAGIINVYQYGNETLHFGGGRLLLRGVNGSGKSTAMNMLLPFLLDADIRRIDAAGEQSAVLRSWMLSGRDETQPQGYLWLEVAKKEEHLCFGCGIRANRSTDQVTTWWFVTSRRPGLDLQLVEDRVPAGRDPLKALLDPDPVFGHEQRAQYRAELRKRMFGGADIEQHLHLLRIVRNPRVGDRLDAELPQYLHDALPQLSEAALDDAAQPLEDLEEHRKNVGDLRRTAETLDAVHATYRNYARTELHRFADRTLEAARVSRDWHRKEERARAAHADAISQHEAAEARKRQLDTDTEKLRGAINALEASEAYKSGAQLNDLRRHVESLARSKAAGDEALRRRQDATGRAARAVRDARQEAASEHDGLRRSLSDLAILASAHRLTARPPSVPSIAHDPGSPPDLDLAPAQPIETNTASRALAALRAAAGQRIQEVDTVETAARAIEPAERALRAAESVAARAEAGRDDANEALAGTRNVLRSTVEAWQASAMDWLESVRRHHEAHGLAEIETPVEIGAVIDEIVGARSAATRLDALTEPAIRHHESIRAEQEAALEQQRERVSGLEERAAELAAKEGPDPPLLGWQQRAGRCFAELVDFAEDVDPTSRARLEAALEASGLLAAELHGDNVLRLANGQVVIAPGAVEVSAPLAELLRADLAEHDAAPGTREAVERILRAISTDLAADAGTVVTVDGEFRLGALRGRHTKPEPEHIGSAARRAALNRLRAENTLALEQARAERDRLATDVESARAALDEARGLRAVVPSDQGLRAALWRRNDAEAAVEKAEEHLRARRAELEAAEQRHADAVASAQETAARLSLPASLDELRETRADLERMSRECAAAENNLARLAQAVERWRNRGDDWRAARADETKSEDDARSVTQELALTQERLQTLEATIGVEYDEIVASIERKTDELTAARAALTEADKDLQQAGKDVTAAEKDRDKASDERERADIECVQALSMLKRALAVPGLVAAAADPAPSTVDDGGSSAPAAASVRPLSSGDAAEKPDCSADPIGVASAAVEATPSGARRLVASIREHVARPEGPPTTAEGVRQSIRRRRDSLGAGWDAEDRQPDEQLPLHVEVSGPFARQAPLPDAAAIVQSQLATMTSLLSTKQHQALRNLLQGLVAREVAEKLHAAGELIGRMNERLTTVSTAHGIGVQLRWRRRDDVDPELAETIGLLAKPPDLRTADEDRLLAEALGRRIDEAHREDPGTPYRELIARVLDYRDWHRMTILLLRAGRSPERLSRRTALSEGEKKIVSYLPLFAAVAASCDTLAESSPAAPRFVLLDDAFAKVSEDNHAKLFGLLVELDLDFIATSERLWGTHDTVPELAITEVIRDADLRTIVLEHSRWNARLGGLA